MSLFSLIDNTQDLPCRVDVTGRASTGYQVWANGALMGFRVGLEQACELATMLFNALRDTTDTDD